MDLSSPSEGVATTMDRAKANENARQANDIWFNKFSDGPILDNLMTNFDSWSVYLHEVTTEKHCRGLLTNTPGPDPIRMNHAKNIQMFFNKTISEDLKDVVLESNAQDTYTMLLSLKPDSNAKRVQLLKTVQNIDPNDISEYVIGMQHLQKQLRDIDASGTHYESLPSAHMTRLLENLSEEQTDKIQYYRKEKWLNKEKATKRDVFLMGQILIDTFKDPISNTANAAKNEGKAYKHNSNYKGVKCKEDHPSWIPYHTWEYCDKNPNTKDPKG